MLKDNAELMVLLAKFAQSYPGSPDGISHQTAYREQRKQGKRLFEEISAATSSGQDIGPAAATRFLPQLLPQLLFYGSWEQDRKQSSWIRINPGIDTGISGAKNEAKGEDIKEWFKNSGWNEQRNWRQIARAILDFLQQCNEDPNQLPEACARLLQLPYFQKCPAVMLVPILNALQPYRFLLLNHKSLSTINYFTNKNYSSELADCPPANASGQIFMSALAAAYKKFTAEALAEWELFELFCHWLVSIEKYNFVRELPDERELLDEGERKSYWQISPGENAKDWEAWRDGKFIALGWDVLGDISGLTRAEFEARCDRAASDWQNAIAPGQENRLFSQQSEWRMQKAELNQVWQFANEIKKGDRVVPNRGQTEVLGIGTVTGSYYFVPNVLNRHRLPVRWDELTPRQVNERGWQKTLIKLDREKFEIICNSPPLLATPKAEVKLEQDLGINPISGRGDSRIAPTFRINKTIGVSPVEDKAKVKLENREPRQQNPNYSLTDLAAETGFDEATLARWVRGIERKKQAILYGPPGTGKTFLAERLARHLIGGGEGFWELVQFHPGYAYEDFIQGIRPATRPDGKLDYPLVPGRFLEFCAKARFALTDEKPHEKRSSLCVLIIDEINRANLSSVFGELFYLLEYRDKEIALAGGSDSFSIPANVRIIGTMNTADKSIALVDNALRRRFAFLELSPNYDILRRYHEREETGFAVEGLIAALQAVNREIGDRNYELGISFFLVPDLTEQIEDIWRMEIEPYLEEYFFGSSDRFNEFRWDRVGKNILP